MRQIASSDSQMVGFLRKCTKFVLMAKFSSPDFTLLCFHFLVLCPSLDVSSSLIASFIILDRAFHHVNSSLRNLCINLAHHRLLGA